jgi:hypothetical protein
MGDLRRLLCQIRLISSWMSCGAQRSISVRTWLETLRCAQGDNVQGLGACGIIQQR